MQTWFDHRYACELAPGVTNSLDTPKLFSRTNSAGQFVDCYCCSFFISPHSASAWQTKHQVPYPSLVRSNVLTHLHVYFSHLHFCLCKSYVSFLYCAWSNRCFHQKRTLLTKSAKPWLFYCICAKRNNDSAWTFAKPEVVIYWKLKNPWHCLDV